MFRWLSLPARHSIPNTGVLRLLASLEVGNQEGVMATFCWLAAKIWSGEQNPHLPSLCCYSFEGIGFKRLLLSQAADFFSPDPLPPLVQYRLSRFQCPSYTTGQGPGLLCSFLQFKGLLWLESGFPLQWIAIRESCLLPIKCPLYLAIWASVITNVRPS